MVAWPVMDQKWMQQRVGSESRIWILPSSRRSSSSDSTPVDFGSRQGMHELGFEGGHWNNHFMRPYKRDLLKSSARLESGRRRAQTISRWSPPTFRRRFKIGISPTSWHGCVVAVTVDETGRLNRYDETTARCCHSSRSSMSRGGHAPRWACRYSDARCGSWR